MVEKPALPNVRDSRTVTEFNFFCQKSFQLIYLNAYPEIMWPANKKMNMIRYDHIPTHGDVFLVETAPNKIKKGSMHHLISEQLLTIMCTKSDKIHRGSNVNIP